MVIKPSRHDTFRLYQQLHDQLGTDFAYRCTWDDWCDESAYEGERDAIIQDLQARINARKAAEREKLFRAGPSWGTF